MAERSSISQTVQIGVEAVPGTLVPANKKFASIGISPGIKIETNPFRSSGYKYPALITLGKEWTESKLSGQPTYDELSYIFAGIMATPVITAQGVAGAQQHVFSPSSSQEDAIKTFSVEQGSAVRAARFAYGLLTDAGLSFSRDSFDLSGTMIGKALEDGIAMTANPTTLPTSPILPKQLDVFLDPTSAALGTTKLLRVLSGEFNFGSRFGPLWSVNSAEPSFSAHVETEPDANVHLKMEADAVGMSPLATVRAGDSVFVRLAATGPEIGAGPETYLMHLDFSLKVADVSEFSDEDGVYAIEWTFGLAHDPTWGKALSAELVNTLAAL